MKPSSVVRCCAPARPRVAARLGKGCPKMGAIRQKTEPALRINKQCNNRYTTRKPYRYAAAVMNSLKVSHQITTVV